MGSRIHFLFQGRKSMMHDQIISRLYTTLINLSPTAYKKRTKQRERERHLSYYHYSPAPSGGLRATNGGTLNDRDSEAWWFRVKKTSISSFIRSVLYLDPNNFNSSSSSGKCDKTAVSASRAPQWTLLVAAASTWPWIRSTIKDSTIAREGASLGLSSTRS
jgi:hypothetical protein